MAPRLGLGGGVTADPSNNLFNLLLDNYPAKAAFALRKLRRSYTGYAMKVREGDTGTNYEADVGFLPDGTIGDYSPIFNKTGGPGVNLVEFGNYGDLFLRTLYDQSGNGIDASETTIGYQCTVMSSGSLITSGGLPAWEYDAPDNLDIDGLKDIEYLDSWYLADADDSTYLYPSDTGDISNFGPVAQNNSGSGNQLGNNYGTSGTHAVTLYVNGASTSPSNRDDTHDLLNGQKLIHHSGGSSDDWGGFQVGRYEDQPSHSVHHYGGKMQEMIFFDSTQSSNRAGIDANLNDYYSIY